MCPKVHHQETSSESESEPTTDVETALLSSLINRNFYFYLLYFILIVNIGFNIMFVESITVFIEFADEKAKIKSRRIFYISSIITIIIFQFFVDKFDVFIIVCNACFIAAIGLVYTSKNYCQRLFMWQKIFIVSLIYMHLCFYFIPYGLFPQIFSKVSWLRPFLISLLVILLNESLVYTTKNLLIFNLNYKNFIILLAQFYLFF